VGGLGELLRLRITRSWLSPNGPGQPRHGPMWTTTCRGG